MVEPDRSIEDLEVLLALRDLQARGLVNLADHLQLSRWQLRRRLTRLEAADLIDAVVAGDARQRHYRLTDPAHRLLDALQRELSKAAAE